MSEDNLAQRFQKNERLTTFVTHLIVALMLGSVAVSVVQFGEYLAPGWNGAYLVPLSVLVALEAMYSRRKIRHAGFFSREYIFYRLTEFVLLFLGIKLVLYLVRGVDRLWADIQVLHYNFWDAFFTNEYILVAGFCFLVWAIAGMFAEELDHLEGDEKLLSRERETGIIEKRPAARRRLANLILYIGGALIFEAALVRLDWTLLWGETPPLRGHILNVVVYFVLALILLSLTQFSVLRVHWSLERIPISTDLAAGWLKYSAIFLLILAAIAFVLPTSYSVGLLDIVAYGISILTSILSALLFLLMLPFFLLMSLFARLFGTAEPVPPPNFQEIIPQQPQAVASAPWLEVLKSILFWAVFLGVMAFSIAYYLRQNQTLLEQLKQTRLLHWMDRLWVWIASWLRGVNENISAAVRAGQEQLRKRNPFRSQQPRWNLRGLRRMSPRERVQFFYLAMLRRGKEKGLPRGPGQTPYEYARRIAPEVPDVEPDVSALTQEFIEARYSLHDISPQKASLVQQYWKRIRKALRTVFNA
jgi:hypothetical protein